MKNSGKLVLGSGTEIGRYAYVLGDVGLWADPDVLDDAARLVHPMPDEYVLETLHGLAKGFGDLSNTAEVPTRCLVERSYPCVDEGGALFVELRVDLPAMQPELLHFRTLGLVTPSHLAQSGPKNVWRLLIARARLDGRGESQAPAGASGGGGGR